MNCEEEKIGRHMHLVHCSWSAQLCFFEAEVGTHFSGTQAWHKPSCRLWSCF